MDIRTCYALINFIKNTDDIRILRHLARKLDEVKHEISYIDFEYTLNNPQKQEFGVSPGPVIEKIKGHPDYLAFFEYLAKQKTYSEAEFSNPIAYDLSFNYSDFFAFIDDITSTNNLISLKADIESLMQAQLTKIYYRKKGLNFKYSLSPNVKLQSNGVILIDRPPIVQYEQADYFLITHYQDSIFTNQTLLVQSLIFDRTPLIEMAKQNVKKSNH